MPASTAPAARQSPSAASDEASTDAAMDGTRPTEVMSRMRKGLTRASAAASS